MAIGTLWHMTTARPYPERSPLIEENNEEV